MHGGASRWYLRARLPPAGLPVGDVEGMAAGALSLLNNPSRLNEMREAARKDAQKRFCATLVVPQYVRYYEQILGQ